MKCHHFNLEGLPVIACGKAFGDDDGLCQFCPKPGVKMCDWIMRKRSFSEPAVTCDKRICADHAQEVGADKDLCPDHQVAYKAWLERKAARAAVS